MIRLTNPFRKRICPYCGQGFYPGNCAVFSSVTTGKQIDNAHPGFLARMFVQPMMGPKYAKELAARQCPNTDCGNLLPYNVECADSYTIAIIGDSSSGKSHYIASCIHQLKQRQMLQLIGCNRIIGQGDTDDTYRNKYYDPVYKYKTQIEGNLQAQSSINEPLIYELVFEQRSFLRPARRVNLLFYDSSGEDMVQQDRLVQYSQFILNASAIIFLADPLTMPRIVNALPMHLKSGALRNDSTSDILNRIIHTFERYKGIEPGTRLKTPIAITISKSDLLKFVIKGGPPRLFLSESAFANRIDTREFEIINEEVRELLQKVGDQVLEHSSQLFEQTSFFAVSATGWPPEAGKFPSIEPLRCLDPLLWALWKIGVVTTE